MHAHLWLLLIDLAGVVCLLMGILATLWRGFQVPELRNHGSRADDLVQWNESTSAVQSGVCLIRRLQFVSQMFQFKRKAAHALTASELVIADPVDGTAFDVGEILVRCACGTSYHQHSWQWLGQKNHGKCVNCRRAGLISTYTVPQLRSAH